MFAKDFQDNDDHSACSMKVQVLLSTHPTTSKLSLFVSTRDMRVISGYKLAGLFFVLLLIFVFPITLNIPVLTIILLPIASLFYSAGYLLFMKGFEIGNISIVAATMNLWAVFTMLIAFIFMGQRLSALQSMGVLMIISGATLASLNWSDIRNKRFQLSSGVKETVLGAFLFGAFWNLSEVISEKIG
ncbi:MAG: DMT family transporter [Deltaproteobacteria bacterium]|nr:DMT family transporter [Deltaproteobacteria bacterium]